MFYKIGFYVLLAIVIACGVLFWTTNPMKRQGALSWVDIYSADPAATIAFLNKNFGITVTDTSKAMGDMDYSVIKARGQLWPFAGIMGTPTMPDGQKVPPHSMIYLTVNDYAAAHHQAIESGAIAVMENIVAGGMRFGIYQIPGGVMIGFGQYGVKE